MLADAQAGDTTALHEWGDAKLEAFRARVRTLERARDAAPTSEAAQALDDLLAAVGPFASVYSAASTAADVDSFLAAVDAIPAIDDATDQKANAAVAVLSSAEATYCR